MFSTILVPLDGSDLARRALPYAAFLARATHARLVLFHAYRPETQDPGADVELDIIMEHSDLASDLREQDIHATTWLSYDEAGPAIVKTAADLRADLIVMSTHGRGGFSQLMFGSVAEEVVRHTSVPVVLVTAKSEVRWTSGLPMQIVVPLDGSEFSEAALGPAGDWARALEAGLVLVRTLGSGIEVDTPWRQRIVTAARQYLEKVALPLRADGLRVEVRVEAGPPDKVIARIANELAPSLAVMATHGRGVLSRMLAESVASETLRKLTVPMLLVRLPHAGEEAPIVVPHLERSMA